MKPLECIRRGSAHHKALWTEEEAERIRQDATLRLRQGATWQQVADQWGVAPSTIRRLVAGNSYRSERRFP